MSTQILAISERGQITIPKKIRDKIKGGHFSCTLEKEGILLRPLQTREEFFAELEEAKKDWEENGGIPFEEVMRKSHLLP